MKICNDNREIYKKDSQRDRQTDRHVSWKKSIVKKLLVVFSEKDERNRRWGRGNDKRRNMCLANVLDSEPHSFQKKSHLKMNSNVNPVSSFERVNLFSLSFYFVSIFYLNFSNTHVSNI
jgi:hypothetical protein